MIDEPGHSTGHLVDPLKEETTMLKTISAAVLAISVIAAPALAAGSGKTAQTPVSKSEQVKAAQAKPVQAKPSTLNANAKMGHHGKHFHHHRIHKETGALKTHSKLAIKHVAPATKRS